MGSHSMRAVSMKAFTLAAFAMLLTVVISVPAEHSAVLDDADALIDAKPEAKVLAAKLAKLENTLNRIKKSCTADDVPKELGEDVGNGQKAKTTQELKQKIKEKEEESDKVADACMPGEERDA